MAVDTKEDAIQILKDQAMDAMIVQDGYEIGYQAIEAAVECLKTGQLSKTDYLFEGNMYTTDNE